MKMDRTGRAPVLHSVGATATARRLEAPEPPPVSHAATATILGIPEREFTPFVREAVMRLTGDLERLRRDLAKAQARLEDVEREADLDHLLPLLNRRAFVRELARQIGLSARYGTRASLLYFDLDDFKSINDAGGHAAGDAVLAHFAEVLLGHVRDSDIVARLGGDEFGVILSHASQAQAEIKATALASKLAASPALYHGREIDVAFSYGTFELKAGDGAETALARADEAMYARKKAR